MTIISTKVGQPFDVMATAEFLDNPPSEYSWQITFVENGLQDLDRLVAAPVLASAQAKNDRGVGHIFRLQAKQAGIYRLFVEATHRSAYRWETRQDYTIRVSPT